MMQILIWGKMKVDMLNRLSIVYRIGYKNNIVWLQMFWNFFYIRLYQKRYVCDLQMILKSLVQLIWTIHIIISFFEWNVAKHYSWFTSSSQGIRPYNPSHQWSLRRDKHWVCEEEEVVSSEVTKCSVGEPLYLLRATKLERPRYLCLKASIK